MVFHSRFGDSTLDSSSLKSFSKSGLIEGQVPFFAGQNVDARMDTIRQSIQYIRKNWDQYYEFMEKLNALFIKHNPDRTKLLSDLLGKRKNWIDRPSSSEEIRFGSDRYDAIRLYTSRGGYDDIFSVMNLAFRSEASEFEKIVNEIVFLVELLNIDLYNYNERNPGVSVFGSEDIVYRGMCVEEKDIENFSKIREQDIKVKVKVKDRYISIPLGFMSSSLERREAENVISRRLERTPSLIPLIWKIRIISLEPELLRQYHQRFPTSVVSPICATRIYDLSDYPEEKEVLLRGPFFQVLDFYQSGTIEGKPLNILEAVMLDSNRDHPSTAELGEDDERARDIFRAIVDITKYKFCRDYYRTKSSQSDIDSYSLELGTREKDLEELLQE